MIFLMLTIFKALKKNPMVLKTQTTYHVKICFLKIVQDASKIRLELK